jgi:hypothetical protein
MSDGVTVTVEWRRVGDPAYQKTTLRAGEAMEFERPGAYLIRGISVYPAPSAKIKPLDHRQD